MAVAECGGDDALEGFLLEMINTATFAIGHLALATGRSPQDWLQQIAVETTPPTPGSMVLD